MNIIEQLLKLIIQILEAAFKVLFEFVEMLVTGIPKRTKHIKQLLHRHQPFFQAVILVSVSQEKRIYRSKILFKTL